MTPTRAIAGLFVLAMLASAGLVVLYLLGGQPQLEGLLLGVALGGIGAGIVIWALTLLEAPVESEERHPLRSPDEVRAQAGEAFDAENLTRRRFLVRLLAAAGALLAAALAIPVLSLGQAPGRALFRTPWRPGMRVVDAAGAPIRAEAVGFDGVTTVFPDGFVGSPDGVALLVRVPADELRLPSGRDDWAPEGCVAYSKICTHVGCPVGLYRAEARELLCPCHQSTFDVRRGAVPVFGPAARPLPQLPLDVDGEGYLVARGDFPEPVGPSFWNMTHQGDA
ncbi:MAG TPA: Rieske 2Fe-2S domain-containing protein [Candidatus Limnocylindria bacterium]|nr:Rieske 2Fe-2S domain-containing protein [Candidatus Limnocylindria bacterium]